jgi:hypothetical protein
VTSGLTDVTCDVTFFSASPLAYRENRCNSTSKTLSLSLHGFLMVRHTGIFYLYRIHCRNLPSGLAGMRYSKLHFSHFVRRQYALALNHLRMKSNPFYLKIQFVPHVLIKKKNIVRFIKSQRLRWAAHVIRMDAAITVKKLTEWEPCLSRLVGRPR